MIVSWRGKGWLIPAVTIPLIMVVSLLIGNNESTKQLAIAGLLIALAAPIWLYGQRLNQGTKFHRFMWIPFEYWALIFPVLAVIIIFASNR